MGGYNPVLNGILRGVQLASLIENRRIRLQNAQSLEAARQETARRNTALEQRQAELDAERAQEKVRDFRLRARESGAVPLDPSQAQAFRGGEDFSVELAPGMATTASASTIEGPGGGLFAFPGPAERGQLDLEQHLEQFAQQEAIRARHQAPPLPARVQDDEGNVNFLDARTGKTIATAKGVGKKSGASLGETAAQRRARLNFERGEGERQTKERVEALANVLLDDAGGDPDRALRLLESQIEQAGNPERSEFLSRQRIAIRRLLKGARTDRAPGRAKELNAGDKALADILAVDGEQLDIMRAISRDMPLKLARAVEAVRNQPPPGESSVLARFGITDPPRQMTIEEVLSGQEGVTAEDIALLEAAGIDIAKLGRTPASVSRKGATLGKAKPKARGGLVPAKGRGAAAEAEQFLQEVYGVR